MYNLLLKLKYVQVHWVDNPILLFVPPRGRDLSLVTCKLNSHVSQAKQKLNIFGMFHSQGVIGYY